MYPTLTETKQSQSVIDRFYGYDHNPKIADGAFFDTENLTTDHYPLLCTRDKRGTVRTGITPNGLLGKKNLAMVDGGTLYYAGQNVSTYVGQLTNSPKQMVSMGAYVCIWPDKVYFNTEKFSDSGYMENRYSTADRETYAVVHPCLQDGSTIDIVKQSSEPSEPTNGMYWLDISAKPFSLKLYSSASKTWAAVVTTYVAISASGIDEGFKENDGIQIKGFSGDYADLNGYNIIQSVKDDAIVVIGMVSGYSGGHICEILREVPDMEYVTESQNRIWGCHYGLNEDNTETLNEIYCCALGDFRNWRRYAGISTDSYTASCGTDGPWTGAITHQGYPLFFKENHLHKVYISTSGAHQIIDMECRGVQDGCSRSMAIVNNVLYYKSRDGICGYDGSLPQIAGSALGSELYYNAVGGSIGNKYYVSMEDEDENSSLFCYDASAGIWMREDDTKALYMSRCEDDLFILTSGGNLLSVKGTEGDLESQFPWHAETGIIGYDTPEHKYVTKFNIRMKLPRGSYVEAFIEYDSDGIWNAVGIIEGIGMNSFVLPVRPVRCDHFRIRIQGFGEVMIYSFTKMIEVSTDGH